MPHVLDENKYDNVDRDAAAKMHKAIAVIGFKLESKLYCDYPEFGMQDRIFLDKIDYGKGTIKIDANTYELKDKSFPTVSPENPFELTEEEREVINSLAMSIRHSVKLSKHISFLFNKGSMFLCCNKNLLYHGCIPMTKDGDFEVVEFDGRKLFGREYLEYINDIEKRAYVSKFSPWIKSSERDFLWYLWCGPKSPLFGKSKLAAFERYFIAESETHKEEMNPYYQLIENREICEKIIEEFGLDVSLSHIINGHVPVKAGENPIKGGGLLYMIDGGISKAYQSKTGMGGYTFISSSTNNSLARHMPHEKNNEKQTPVLESVKLMEKRIRVCDTDMGKDIELRIEELYALLDAYSKGIIKERQN